MSFKVPEKNRVTIGSFGTSEEDGNNGAFTFMTKSGSLRVIASDGIGWEHVSVSRSDRCPTWEEMCFIKDKFWDAIDCVVQFHPPISEYVNNHPNCLHLWRKVGSEFELPPTWTVGIK